MRAMRLAGIVGMAISLLSTVGCSSNSNNAPAAPTTEIVLPSATAPTHSPSITVPFEPCKLSELGYLDPSGLWVLLQSECIPTELTSAFSVAKRISLSLYNDFGGPKIREGLVVLPAISDAAISLSEQDRQTQIDQLRADAQMQPLVPAPSLPEPIPSDDVLSQIKLVASPASLNIRYSDISNEIFDMRNDPPCASAGIVATGTGLFSVVVTMKQLTPECAQEIVKRFGILEVFVEVDPNFMAGY